MSRPLAVAAWALSVSCPVIASAAKEPLDVATLSCSWLGQAELIRLTRLELSSILSERGFLKITYTCGSKDVTIGISNAKTGVRVERAITGACCEDAEPERTLALLSLGLYRAAKGLLGDAAAAPGATVVLPATPAGPSTSITSPNAPVPSGTGEPAKPAAAPTPTRPAQPPPPLPQTGWVAAERSIVHGVAPALADTTDFRHQMGIVGRTRVHNLEKEIVTNGVSLGYRAWPWRTLALGASLDVTFGSTERIGGDVDARLLSLGGLVAWRFANWSAVALTGSLGGGATLVTVEGDAKADNVGSGSATGATANARLLLTPSFRTGPIEIGVPLEFGFLFRAPRGEVAGDAPVQLDGIWAGAGLAVSFGWSPRLPPPQHLGAHGGRR